MRRATPRWAHGIAPTRRWPRTSASAAPSACRSIRWDGWCACRSSCGSPPTRRSRCSAPATTPSTPAMPRASSTRRCRPSARPTARSPTAWSNAQRAPDPALRARSADFDMIDGARQATRRDPRGHGRLRRSASRRSGHGIAGDGAGVGRGLARLPRAHPHALRADARRRVESCGCAVVAVSRGEVIPSLPSAPAPISRRSTTTTCRGPAIRSMRAGNSPCRAPRTVRCTRKPHSTRATRSTPRRPTRGRSTRT